MTNITNVPEGICFLSQLGEIVINETSSDNRRVEIYADPYIDGTVVKSNQPALYDEVLYADAYHNITVCDVADLLHPHMKGYQVRGFMVKAGDETAVFVVVNSGKMEVCGTAGEFLQQCFLTTNTGTRRTSMGNREVLHYTEVMPLSHTRRDCGGVLWTGDCGKGRTTVKAEVAISLPQPYDIVGYLTAYMAEEGDLFPDTENGGRKFPFVIKGGELSATVEFSDEYWWYYPELYGAAFATSVDMENRKYTDTLGQEHSIYDIARQQGETLPDASFRLCSLDSKDMEYIGYVNVPEGGSEDKYEDVRAEFLADLGLTEEEYTMPYMGGSAPFVRAYYSDESYKDFPVSGVTQLMRRCPSQFFRTSSLYVSSSQFVEEGKELMRYVVIVGDRRQEYIIDGEHGEPTGVLLFINSFGVPEYLYVNADVKGMPEYERSAAVINGVYRNYRIKETRYWEADTGMLTEEEEEWVLDMLRSEEVYICRNGEKWKGIVITESKSESSTNPYALTSYTFKYRMAERRQSFVTFRTSPSIFTQEYTVEYE